MTADSLIVHEWFYDGGPETYEYLLPCRKVDPKHENLFGDWICRFTNLSPSDASLELHHYLDEIEIPEIAPLTNLVRSLKPNSLIVNEDQVWLLCKSAELFSELSAHGNMILLPPPTENVEWPTKLSHASFDTLRHLMCHLGGMRIDIPPTCGMHRILEMQPAIEDENTGLWTNIRSWEGSFPIYNVGNGDTVLVDANGQFGRWDHEMMHQDFVDRMVREHGMTKPNDGAVFLIGDISAFVTYVAAETGLAK